MSNDIHFKPFQREHKHFDDVANTRKDIRIDMDKIAELTDGDPAEEIAQEIYEAEIASAGSFKNYISVEKPVLDGDMWIIHKVLSDLGKSAHKALQGGVLWHIKDGGPDWEETKSYYRSMMTKGQIEMRFVELLIETKNDELKDLRSELVYFKLKGERRGEVIYAIADAA